jgi:hypothetical protein
LGDEKKIVTEFSGSISNARGCGVVKVGCEVFFPQFQRYLANGTAQNSVIHES